VKLNNFALFAFCLAPAIVSAQGVNGGSTAAPNTTPPNAAMRNQTMPAASGTSSQSQLSQVDADFVSKAAAGGAAQVQAGQLAIQQGDGRVKTIARAMVNDHEKANKELEALAKAKGIDVNAAPDPQQAEEINSLRGQKGKAFDDAYLNAQLGDHEATIALFQQEASQGSDPALKAFAKKTLPTLRHHEALVKSASGKAG
jgi:putative membrane protein